MAPMSNAERQARWREKRNALAAKATDPAGIAALLNALHDDAIDRMSALRLEQLEKAAHRVYRMARTARVELAKR